jgi:hypothetical protein
MRPVFYISPMYEFLHSQPSKPAGLPACSREHEHPPLLDQIGPQ